MQTQITLDPFIYPLSARIAKHPLGTLPSRIFLPPYLGAHDSLGRTEELYRYLVKPMNSSFQTSKLAIYTIDSNLVFP